MHLHGDLAETARLYGEGILRMRADDVVFSAAKLFFAYGLGNAMTFPFAAGASSVLLADRPTPQSVVRLLREEKPTFFFGVPTLFAGILADSTATDLGGRWEDVIRAGGQWVSPAEVESALVAHPSVLEAAVVAHKDENQLDKPKAFVVLKPGARASSEELQRFVKERLAPFKYPRWVEFVEGLPKTATGKIQRFKLRVP